jgi:kynurenine formamidase
VKRANFDLIAEKVRNWGRWGESDQRGTLNHIGPAQLRDAAACVSEGKMIRLGLNYGASGPQQNLWRFNPMLYVSILSRAVNPNVPDFVYSDDVIHMPLQCATQWDALGHVHYNGVLYNNCRARDVVSERGTSKQGVEHLASPGIVGRGVLLDIAALKGVDTLPKDHAISPDDLNDACRRQNVEIVQGDIVLIRTGHIRRFTVDSDRAAFNGLQPGVAPACAEWIYDKSVAAVAADNTSVEIVTGEMSKSETPLPFHMLTLRDMGCPLGEMFDLEALSKDCAKDGRYTFMLSASPLPFVGAFGSPLNPLALK